MKQKTLHELAGLCDAQVEGDGSLSVSGPSGLDDAGPQNISFLALPSYAPKLSTTRAGAVLVGTDTVVERDDLPLLRCENPELAFNAVVMAFAPDQPPIGMGIHPTAVVHATADVAADACVAALVTIGPGARVESNTVLHAGVRIGAHSIVGKGSNLHANVALYPHTHVGEFCVVHAGTVLGADGFGFRFDGTRWVKTPQVGNVVIEDDVEVGANVTIDCARFGSTIIGRGTKIDNLVQIGHNVRVGENCLILSQVGVSGSTSLGSGVILARQVGITGHIHIGDGARIGAQSGVSKDVPAGQEMFGTPAGPSREKMRSLLSADRSRRKISRLQIELQALTRIVEELRARGGEGRQFATP